MKTKLLTIATMVALMLGTMTKVQAQAPCLPQMHGLIEHQSASCGITQMTFLATGWNFFSTYIVIDDPEEGMLMLQEALGENGLTIKSSTDFTTYADGEWGDEGDLEEIDNTQMYLIKVSADCTVELQGSPCNPEDYEITINPGWNYIGFPSAVAISIEDAFADFEAEDGDKIKSSTDFSTFADGEWGDEGDLEELTPGQGYMYYSAAPGVKTLVISTGAKARRANPNFGKIKKQPIEVMPTEAEPTH
jgi:hypothetical protein